MKLSRVNTIVSKISKDRTKDGKEHTAGRSVPFLVLATDDAKGFASGVAELLAVNKALSNGEKITVVRANGTEVEAVPTDDIMFDGRAPFPKADLPLTYSELADAINQAIAQVQRNKMGAKLTADFKKDDGKKATSTAAADGVVAEDATF